MSSFKNSINFTPIHPRQTSNIFESNYSQSQSQSNCNNNKIFSFPNNNNTYNSNNYGFKFGSKQYNINPPYSINNNYVSNYETINEFSPCFILVTGLDEYTKNTFNNFLENKNISLKDIKIIGRDKIIIQFGDEKNRNDFTQDYNNIRKDLIGVRIQYINEEEKDRIINNNANKVVHNTSYFNNYMNNDKNNMILLPKKKTNFRKFLEVFINL